MAVVVSIAALALVAPVGAQLPAGPAPADVLDLGEVLELARRDNPRLRALRAAAEGATYREPDASTLPDPTFQIGLMNFGLPDFNTGMAMSMAPSVQLMQMVPFPGKLGLRGKIAGFSASMASATAEEAWWEVRGVASALFYDLYALDRRIEVMRETLSLLQDFQQVAKAMYAAGSGRQADVLRADVEVARLDGDIRQMAAMRAGKASRLNAVVDRPAATDVPSPALGALPTRLPDPTVLEVWARENRPVLVRARLGIERAQSRSELADKQIWPDITIGLSYGQRDRGSGAERMASAMLGFNLPIHAGRRQYAMRDEAAAMRRLADAELQGREADVNASIGVLLAELERARSLTELYRDEVIPTARVTVESAFSSYRVGAVDFMTLVDAQMTVNRHQGDLYALLGDYGRAIAALESTVGRVLPRTGPVLREER